MNFAPSMERVMDGVELRAITLGHLLVDAYLEFVGARGAVNTWLATAYDLKVFFEVVGKEPAEVTSADVFAFLAQQRTPRHEKVVRIAKSATACGSGRRVDDPSRLPPERTAVIALAMPRWRRASASRPRRRNRSDRPCVGRRAVERRRLVPMLERGARFRLRASVVGARVVLRPFSCSGR